MTLVGLILSIRTEKSDDEMSEGIKIFDPKIITENIMKKQHPQHANKFPLAC